MATIRRRYHSGAAPTPTDQRGLCEGVIHRPGRGWEWVIVSLSDKLFVFLQLTPSYLCFLQDQLIQGCSAVYCPLEEFKHALSSYSLSSELYHSLCDNTEGLTKPWTHLNTGLHDSTLWQLSHFTLFFFFKHPHFLIHPATLSHYTSLSDYTRRDFSECTNPGLKPLSFSFFFSQLTFNHGSIFFYRGKLI